MQILRSGAAVLLLAAAPGQAAPGVCWKATSLMWDAAQGRAIPTSVEMLDRLRRAFTLWEKAGKGAVSFRYDGQDAPGYDGTTSIPYDGCVHAVLHGERNFGGELAHGNYNGEIPEGYKRGYFFVSRKAGAADLGTLAHEIGHTLGLPHAAVPESILFSGPRSVGGEPATLSEQDGADLRARWAPGAPGLYSISGTIETEREHPFANVFAESVAGGKSWSARSDHMGKFSIAIAAAGDYRLAARPVLVASDLNQEARGGMRESWFVSGGESVPDKARAAVLAVSDAAPAVTGLRLRTLDTAPRRPRPAPPPDAPTAAATAPEAEVGGRPPVLRLSFDRGFDDEGPQGLKAKAEGDEVLLVPGVKGRALFLGGTEDWLDLPLGDRLAFGRGFSLEFWFRRDDWENPYRGGSGWQTLAALTTSASLNITAPGCPLHKPWALEASVSRYRKDVRQSDVARAFTAPGSVPPGRWMHAAMVYDQAGKSLTVYLDGAPANQAKDAPPPDMNWRRLRLGTWYKANQAFRGAIDEVAVYDFPRSPEEIARAAGR